MGGRVAARFRFRKTPAPWVRARLRLVYSTRTTLATDRSMS